MQTEDEQVEKLKTWLKENGMSIVFGVIIGVGGIGGYNYWNHYQQTRSAEASSQYAGVMVALTAGAHEQVADAVDALLAEYPDTDYALLAQLALARSHVDNADFDAAAQVLAGLAASAGEKPIAYVARTRLAAVQLQLGDSDAALITLADDFPEAFAARVDELRGDALAMQGKVEEAAEAYRKARSAELQPANVEFLQQKLDELGIGR